MSAATARTEAWSRYWASGATHSCLDYEGGTYGGAIGAHWRQVFQSLPEPATLLDIGCGNGALARLMLQTRPAAAIECHAVDAAAIDPRWAAGQPRVRLHAQVAAEALPFPDAHFDLVISQYGIEYSALDRSLPEALRVCRPGGQLHFVMHRSDAQPCRLAKAELAHLDWLEAPAGWLDAATAMLGPMHLSASAQGQAELQRDAARYEPVRRAFDASTAALHERRAASACPDVLVDAHNAAVSAFRTAHEQGAAAAASAMDQLRSELQDIRSRLQDLVENAPDAQRIAAIEALLHRHAARFAWAPLTDRGVLKAMALTIHPAR